MNNSEMKETTSTQAKNVIEIDPENGSEVLKNSLDTLGYTSPEKLFVSFTDKGTKGLVEQIFSEVKPKDKVDPLVASKKIVTAEGDSLFNVLITQRLAKTYNYDIEFLLNIYRGKILKEDIPQGFADMCMSETDAIEKSICSLPPECFTAVDKVVVAEKDGNRYYNKVKNVTRMLGVEFTEAEYIQITFMLMRAHQLLDRILVKSKTHQLSPAEFAGDVPKLLVEGCLWRAHSITIC